MESETATELRERSKSAQADIAKGPEQRIAIVVLGMHRSGTSIVTRAVNLLGAALPKTIMPPAEGNNEAGFWEPLPLVELNERMLAETGSRWDDWRAFDPSALGGDRLKELKQEFAETVVQEYGDARLFTIKDPRICRFVPFYEAALGDLGIAPRYVLPHRNPLAVIASLENRDAMTPTFAGLLWLRYVLDAEAATRGRPRSFVSYEDFLDDWRAPSERIAALLGIEWPRSIKEAGPEIDGELSRDLQHHAPKQSDLDRNSEVAGWIKDTYRALLSLTEGHETDEVFATLDRVRREFDSGASLFGKAAFPEIAERERRLTAERDNFIQIAEDRGLALENREQQIEALKAVAAEHERGLRLLESRLTATEKRMEDEIGVREQRIASLEKSWVWRSWTVARRFVFFPHTLTFQLGRRLELRPFLDLEGTRVGKVNTWTITGPDPQFRLVWSPRLPLPPGRYELSVDIGEDAATQDSMHLYFNSGQGFNLAEVVLLNLHPAPEGGRLVASFDLPAWAMRLRLDPREHPRSFSMGEVRLKRVGWGRSLSRRYAAGLNATNYESWINAFDRLTDRRTAELRDHLTELNRRPLISVLMPVYNTPETLLREAIESVRAQIYENWELCIADDHSTQPHVRRVLEEYTAQDARIKVVYREENGHIARASNSAFELVTGEWVALLDHDDLLRPHALAEVAMLINRRPDAQLIYSDEDKIRSDGEHYDPYFKPEFSRELFRSQNYLNHLTLHRAENIRAVGGWRPGFEGSQDYDLNLRVFERINAASICHIPKVLYHWRAAEGSTALEGSEKDYAYSAGMRALREHVERTGLDATVEEAVGTPFYRVRFAVPEPAPLVSLIIPTRDRVDLLRSCLASIREKTSYPNYEIIIVDNGSVETATLEFFKELESVENVRVLPYVGTFNFSAINNYAVKEARGAIVGLVNNDIEVISPDWLSEMVSWAAQPDVGCVGSKLYYADDTIQHAGVITGLGGVAGHSHKYFPRDHPGYFFRLKILQNLSAVTAACLVVRKSVYEEVGGLNEEELTVAFNDVDFCMRVREAGYSNVWTPYAELYHLESVSRGSDENPVRLGRFRRELAFMRERWKGKIIDDPFYSPNLTLDREDFSLSASGPRV